VRELTARAMSILALPVACFSFFARATILSTACDHCLLPQNSHSFCGISRAARVC